MTHKIIGVSGKKRHGKDTVGRLICNSRPNVVTLAYADALKREVAEMIVSYVDKNPQQWSGGVIYSPALVQKYIDLMNNDQIDPETGMAFKEQFRLVLQWWGTEFRRKMFGDDYWRRKLLERLNSLSEDTLAIVTDVRFPDEVTQIKHLGGIMVNVYRPGMDDSSTHSSETALDNPPSTKDGFVMNYFDTTIVNDGSLSELQLKVHEVLTTYGY